MSNIIHLPARAAERPTIASECDAFLSDLDVLNGVSANTLRAYRSDLGVAAAALTAPLDELTTSDIEDFFKNRAGQESRATTTRRRSSLNAFFGWAQRHGLCTSNPVTLARTGKPDRAQPQPISDADLAKLRPAMHKAPQPFRLIFILLDETGMHADEALSLDVGDVVLDAGRERLRLRGTKANRDRDVVLHPDVQRRSLRGLRAHLRSLGDVPATSPLFRSRNSTRLSYDSLHYQWGKVCEAAGVAGITLHQLRHTFATAMIREHPVHLVQAMLGHADPRMTMRYAEVSGDEIRAAYAGQRKRRH